MHAGFLVFFSKFFFSIFGVDCKLNFSRAQNVAEFVLVLAAVISISFFVMQPAFKQSEVTLALSAAKLASQEYAAQSLADIKFAQLPYKVDYAKGMVVLMPRLYAPLGTNLAGEETILVNKIADKILGVVNPTGTVSLADNCLQGSLFCYCIRPCLNDNPLDSSSCTGTAVCNSQSVIYP